MFPRTKQCSSLSKVQKLSFWQRVWFQREIHISRDNCVPKFGQKMLKLCFAQARANYFENHPNNEGWVGYRRVLPRTTRLAAEGCSKSSARQNHERTTYFLSAVRYWRHHPPFTFHTFTFHLSPSTFRLLSFPFTFHLPPFTFSPLPFHLSPFRRCF